MQRRILGIAAVVFLLAAGAIWFWRPEMSIELAFFSRMGALLLAAWLAFEDVQRLPGWLLVVLPVVLVVIVRWPRLLLLLIPALVVLAILRRVISAGQR
jgi:hypothetical protein